MKVSSISKSNNVNCKAKIRFNNVALEQLSKTKVKDLEKTCKKMGNPQDVILIASKAIDTKYLTASDITKRYVNAISYRIKNETGLAIMKDTTENFHAGNSIGNSKLSENILNFLKKINS